MKKLDDGHVYLVFDRYYTYSIKSGTRSSRANNQASRVHKLTAETPLPSQQVVLTLSQNKVQLVDMICEQLVTLATAVQHDYKDYNHKLVVTGSIPAPLEVDEGIVIRRHNMATSHEEALLLSNKWCILHTSRKEITSTLFLMIQMFFRH